MTLLSIFTAMSLLLTPPHWLTHFDVAKKVATENKEYMLLNFSGSDWCGPCIRTTREIFETPSFENYSRNNLVLVKADFPRLKRNQPDKLQVKENEALAEKYNNKGIFPLTLLLNANGDVIKTWEGFPHVSPDEFINQVKQAINDAGK